MRDLLLKAEARSLASSWVYLPRCEVLTLETLCFVATDKESDTDDRGIPIGAIADGFPVEGLETSTVEDTVSWCRQFSDPPPAELLLESFVYYWRFDAFLPAPGASNPPPSEEIKQQLDREFYDSLGPERSDRLCKHPGCGRGAIWLSALCRVHHFENIKGEACTFEG